MLCLKQIKGMEWCFYSYPWCIYQRGVRYGWLCPLSFHPGNHSFLWCLSFFFRGAVRGSFGLLVPPTSWFHPSAPLPPGLKAALVMLVPNSTQIWLVVTVTSLPLIVFCLQKKVMSQLIDEDSPKDKVLMSQILSEPATMVLVAEHAFSSLHGFTTSYPR